MKLLSILAVAALATPAVSFGQTVTVNKAATPDATTFNTISAALAAVEADAAEPNVVQVTDDGVYEEIFNITTPVTVEATGSSKATLAVLANSNGQDGVFNAQGGIFINLPASLSSGTVVLRNLNILPALSQNISGTTNNRLRSAIENGNNNLYLELDNCHIGPNKENAPLVDNPLISRAYVILPHTNPAQEPYDANVSVFGGHGIVLGRSYTGYTEGAGVELLVKDTIITHFRGDYQPAGVEPERFPTEIVMHGPFGSDPNNYDPSQIRITRVEGKSALTYSGVIISAAGDINIEGTEEDPIHLLSSNHWHVRLDGPAFNYRNFTHTVFSNMSRAGILDRGFGPVRWTFKDSIMFYALNQLFLVDTENDGDTVVHPALGTVRIENSTLVAGRESSNVNVHAIHTMRFDVGTEADLHIENSILGGKMNLVHAANVISVAGNNTVTGEGNAIITQGPYALRAGAPFSVGTNATLPANIADQYAPDPEFVGTNIGGSPTYPADPGFLDVQNEWYATANSEGGPLGGGADYVGDISNVSDWAIY